MIVTGGQNNMKNEDVKRKNEEYRLKNEEDKQTVWN